MLILRKLPHYFLCAALCLNPNLSFASDFINTLKHNWALAKYQMPKSQAASALEKLIDQANDYQNLHPKDPQAALWHGTILATYASVKGGMGALPYTKEAKNHLETAIELNPKIDQGLAQAVLGSLYARVPGWPVSFGSKAQAQRYFKTALKLNPNGLDTNFYYAYFLVEQQNYNEAGPYIHKGLQAKIRPDQSIRDQGRKKELQELRLKIKNAE